MRLQLFGKLSVDKCMILLSFTKQIWNNTITTITVTLNIYISFNVLCIKTNISSMCIIFGKGGEGEGLLMWASLKTLFEILNLKNLEKCVHIFEIGRRLHRWIAHSCGFDLLRSILCFYRLRGWFQVYGFWTWNLEIGWKIVKVIYFEIEIQ